MGLNIVIGGVEGKYYGEWKEADSLLIPHGRGALDCEDKLILGYLEDGEWASGSNQVVIQKQKDEFRVHKLVKGRPNSKLLE